MQCRSPQYRAFLIISAVLLLPQIALARKVQPRSMNVAKLWFARDLQVGGDIQLRGPAATSIVRLKLPPSWQPGGPASLHLLVEHSQGLQGDKSFLAVSFNYGLLRSIRLDETNAAGTEITVVIPRASIRQTNELVLTVDQVDKSANPLTVISSRSFFELPYVEIPIPWDLGSLRRVFSNGPSTLSELPAILLPTNPSSSTLEATALVVANLIAHSPGAFQPLKVVQRFSDWAGPLFVIGTPTEQPELRSLAGETPLIFYQGRNSIGVTSSENKNPNATDGYMGIALNGPYHVGPVIFLTGNSPYAVLRAARTLASPNWVVGGRLARITGDVSWPSRRIREWDGFIPPTNSFHLSDLDHSDILLAYPDGATIPLRAPPDAVFLNYGHEITLKLALSREFYLPGSYIVLKLNGSELGKYPLPEFGLTVSLRVEIPARLLAGDNVLTVLWQGPMPGTSLTAVGWILRDTEFELPRNYQAELPDLGLLRNRFYPFSLKSDFSDVLLVVPDRMNADLISAFLATVAGLARLAPSEYVALRIARIQELKDYDLANSHLLFLNSDESGNLPVQISTVDEPTMKAVNVRRRIWEITSPWSTRKCILVISARTSTELVSAAESVFAPDTLNHLTGDTALFDGNKMSCLTLRPRRRLVDISYNLTLQVWLREHWMALPIVATALSTALFLMVRIALRRNRSRSLAAATKVL
jgi:cellulose synthase operon protein B